MQHTLNKSYTFSGKGLHTGRPVTMTIQPAEAGRGIVFCRKDLGPDALIEALATNVGATSRSTTLEKGGAAVSTIEHLMSAAAGLGIDNMLVTLDAEEVPILDGSAQPYVRAIAADGLAAQQGERRQFRLKEEFHYSDPESGASIDIFPGEEALMELTIDFNSKVLGIQSFKYSGSVDYASQIAPCRTFCFLHELEYLIGKGLVRGGDMDNAIVIVEHPASEESIARLKAFFGIRHLEVRQGYLNNLQLHFPDEIVRHKMLDMIGDFSLLGAPLLGTIIACKTGHRINTRVCKALLESNLLIS